MARYEFKLPDIGEGVAEGEIVEWRVAVGDLVREDQPLVEVMTDKATVTITAPRRGTVLEVRGRVGETVKVHSVLVVFELPSSVHAPPPVRATSPSPPLRANGASSRPPEREVSSRAGVELQDTLPGVPTAATDAARTAALHAYFNEKPLATPATRKYARDKNIDLCLVRPTGPQGRVTRRDVEGFSAASAESIARAMAEEPTSTERRPMTVHPPAGSEASLRGGAADAKEERIPLAGLRRRIAQKMARAKATAAHSTFVEECDATELRAMRARLREAAEAQGVKLSYLPFIVRAVVAALKKHPIVNATLDEATNEIVLRRAYHIGIAAATDAGLMVPVIRDADRKSLVTIARDVERLADEARTGKVKLDDLQGSTFTITSLGAHSGLLATPIINFPEVAILGVHRMKEKPVVRDGQIVIGNVMLLSLSFDHRIVDGHIAAAFTYEVISYLEHPERLLLEMA